MQHSVIGHDDAKLAVTFREMRSYGNTRLQPAVYLVVACTWSVVP